MSNSDSDRLALGAQTLAALDGTDATNLLQGMGDLGRLLVSFVFGEIYPRGQLSFREREIATIAVLAAQGRERQLRNHLVAGLKSGLTVRDLEELVIQTAPYAGFPAAIEAWNTLKAVVAQDLTGDRP
jgi:4-carboxymuconolactone decarboxylase